MKIKKSNSTKTLVQYQGFGVREEHIQTANLSSDSTEKDSDSRLPKNIFYFAVIYFSILLYLLLYGYVQYIYQFLKFY